jgi:bacterioferritin-associated ferredoxin
VYVCLCKGLTESQVADTAGACADAGEAKHCSFLSALHLDSDDACGYCAEDPGVLLAIAGEVWRNTLDTSPATG